MAYSPVSVISTRSHRAPFSNRSTMGALRETCARTLRRKSAAAAGLMTRFLVQVRRRLGLDTGAGAHGGRGMLERQGDGRPLGRLPARLRDRIHLHGAEPLIAEPGAEDPPRRATRRHRAPSFGSRGRGALEDANLGRGARGHGQREVRGARGRIVGVPLQTHDRAMRTLLENGTVEGITEVPGESRTGHTQDEPRHSGGHAQLGDGARTNPTHRSAGDGSPEWYWRP